MSPPRGVRFTNSRTIFWIFRNSRTREKWQVSRFQERDFVNSRTTINKYARIHEFTNKFSSFHEFANDISSFHESRTKSFSRIHERFFSFSRIHKRKKAGTRLYEHHWGASLTSAVETRLGYRLCLWSWTQHKHYYVNHTVNSFE